MTFGGLLSLVLLGLVGCVVGGFGVKFGLCCVCFVLCCIWLVCFVFGWLRFEFRFLCCLILVFMWMLIVLVTPFYWCGLECIGVCFYLFVVVLFSAVVYCLDGVFWYGVVLGLGAGVLCCDFSLLLWVELCAVMFGLCR